MRRKEVCLKTSFLNFVRTGKKWSGKYHYNYYDELRFDM